MADLPDHCYVYGSVQVKKVKDRGWRINEYPLYLRIQHVTTRGPSGGQM